MEPLEKDIYKFKLEVFKQNRGLILLEGLVFVILGLFAISTPIIWSYATDIFLGLLFLAGGIVQACRTWKTWDTELSFISSVSAIVMLICGLIMLINPAFGLVALTTLLGIYFLIDGVSKCALTFQLYLGMQKFWVFLGAVISFVLAIIIFSALPHIAQWLLGLFVGINMLLTGLMLLAFYFTLPSNE